MNLFLLQRTSNRLPGVFLLGLCTLILDGCTVGPKYNRPKAEVPPAYKEATDWKPARPNEQNFGGTWWQIFEDPQLNDL